MSTRTHTQDDNSDAAEIIRVAQHALEPFAVQDDTNYLIATPDGSYTLVDLERVGDKPKRPRGVFYPSTVGSLIDYVESHQRDGHTTLWVHPTEGKVAAVLDDHSADAPAWREHRAELVLLHTEEWKFWLSNDGRLLDQQSFAEHMEDGLPDIVHPDGADLLEIAQSIHGTTEAKFRSGVKLQSGEVKIQYDETVEAKAGEHGELSIPTEFTLGIAPFVGNPLVELKARLRYRPHEGQLRLGYKLEQPERAVRAALDQVATDLEKQFDRVYRGTPAR